MTELPLSQYVGRTVALRDFRAVAPDGVEIKATGRYTIDEYNFAEPDVGILGEDFILVPSPRLPDEAWERVAIAVDPWELLALIDPERIARERAQEDTDERERLREELLLHAGDMGDTQFSILRNRYQQLGGWWPMALTDWETDQGRELALAIKRARGE